MLKTFGSRATLAFIFSLIVAGTARADRNGVFVAPSPDVVERVKVRDQRAKSLTKIARKQDVAPTIGHEILNMEMPLNTVSSDMFRLVDDVIVTVKSRIGTRPADGDANAMRTYALATLKLIDDVMVERNFVYPPHDELTLTFSDSLIPTKLQGDHLQRVLDEPANTRRKPHILAHSNEDFFLSDCDTASFMYLAVGEALNLPLFLVEVPKHNFVRWYYSDTDYQNWETMYGTPRTDQVYISGYGIPQASIDNGAFLTKMPRSATIGYCHCIVAMGFEKQKNYKDAQLEYRIGIKTYTKGPLGWNNLAWSLVTSPDPAYRNGVEAVTLATKAVSIFGEANNLDTLACAYAEAGDFAKAIETEEKALEIEPSNPDFRADLEGFRQNKTWIASHPQNLLRPHIFFGHR